MNINVFGVGSVNSPKTALNKSDKINFQGKSDIVDFSETIKERNKIAAELTAVGFSKEQAYELIKEYLNTPEYDKLINGEYDETFGETFSYHCVGREGNLTPAEAIVYLHFALDDYYIQHTDLDYTNVIMSPSTYDAEDHDIGSAEFSPLEMAKYMNEGFDEVLSGLILKGKIDPETAKEVFGYYDLSHDSFSYSVNVQLAEYTALKLSQNMDKLRYFTSDEKDENGNLVSGLTRPLTKAEATSIVVDDYLRSDPKSLNNYIELNRRFGESLYSVDLGHLWDVDPDRYGARQTNITRLKVKRTVQDLAELIDCVAKTYPSLPSEFFDDIKALDNSKFFGRYLYAAIKFDAILSSNDDRELRQKNIQVLNTISEELLNKMTSGSTDKKGHFSLLSHLYRNENLEKRVQELEEYRINNPIMFNAMTKDAVMDYMTDSTFYTKSKETLDEFLDILHGTFQDKPSESARIVEFPVDSGDDE